MWAFNTRQARAYVLTADAAVVLTPTPKFLNPSDPNKTGTNQPHGHRSLLGDRTREFFSVAFADAGIAFQLVAESPHECR